MSCGGYLFIEVQVVESNTANSSMRDMEGEFYNQLLWDGVPFWTSEAHPPLALGESRYREQSTTPLHEQTII